MQVDGVPVWEVEVEVETRVTMLVAAPTKQEAEEIAEELQYSAPERATYAEDVDFYAQARRAEEPPEGVPVWVGGEDGDWTDV